MCPVNTVSDPRGQAGRGYESIGDSDERNFVEIF